MNKIIISFLILICFFTTLICVKKPTMHNKILVYNSDYVIIEDEKPEIKVKKTEKEIPTKEQKPVKQTEKKIEKAEKRTQNDIKQKEQIKQRPVQKEVKKEIKKEIKTISQQTQQKTKENTNNILTEQEEFIAWNKWHSDLQNKLMNDIKLPILPEGTIFKFSFVVDKFGKITNIQTNSTNSQYTPFAIEFIAPVIRSYQGTSILNFPEGSNRTKTTFNGGFKISQTSKFSSPNDYNDTEKVKK